MPIPPAVGGIQRRPPLHWLLQQRQIDACCRPCPPEPEAAIEEDDSDLEQDL